MEENQKVTIEPKLTFYGFKLDHYNYASDNIPFQDVELIFLGKKLMIKSKIPKTKREFQKIFNDYITKEKKNRELDELIEKKAMEMHEEEEDY